MSQKNLKSSLRFRELKAWALAALATSGAAGCGTTPLDSVIAEGFMNHGGTDTGGSGSGGMSADVAGGGSFSGGGSDGGNGGSAGSPDCQSSTFEPGRYQIRDRVGDRCLQKGEPDPTLYPVFTALLAGDCSVPEAEWDFFDLGSNLYALHNVGIDANLDVRAGASIDGTPLVLYMPRQGTNQTFMVRPHVAPYFALIPLNAVTKCVEAVGAGAQLSPCDDTVRAQDFNLVRVDCP